MLQIITEQIELYDPQINRFKLSPKSRVLTLEHSLVSISKWESIWHKPFISDTKKTAAETMDYIKCMTITQNVSDDTYYGITDKLVDKITNYINDPYSATTIHEIQSGQRSRELITSELIYFWMVSFNIPFECDKWHLNRLLNLIRICNEKNKPAKKYSTSDLHRQFSSINAANRSRLHTKG